MTVAESEDFEAVRERIARALWKHDPPYTTFEWDEAEPDDEDKAYYLGYADAVLDALGLEQVGWRCKHGLSEGRCGPRPDEPVYRLAGLSGSSEGETND